MRLSSALPLLAATTTTTLAFDLNTFLPRRHAVPAATNNDAADLVKRATPLANLMITDLNNLTDITKQTTSAIIATTDLNSAVAITKINTNLIDAITKAQNDVSSDPALLTDDDAQALGPPTQYLAYAANASIGNLIRKKDLFFSLNIQSIVITSLQQQKNASVAFGSLLLAKIPSDIRPVADALNGQIAVSIQMGIDCFNNMNASCVTAIVDPNRTADAAMDSGAIPKSAATRGEVAGWVVIAGAMAALLFSA